ncbi:hypothetical protein [Streptomyces sp. SBT349]|uniref:hypothetical protein n=1 Tax=Streptomyces sp. SBT349 TaxID=1580539 RepID=UPI00066DC73C|nr:hypothetical protein [Streptomyces sp. SBT349]
MGLDMGLTEDGAAVGAPAHLGGVAYDQLDVTGFGAARRFPELGAVVVAVPTAHGALHGPDVRRRGP